MLKELKGEMTKLHLCPIRYALDIIGGKWKLPIICLLSGGTPTRYSVIKRKLNGITNMMLSQSLKELEAYGIVFRQQYNVIPPRVEYSLTEEGRSLLPALQQLSEWSAAHMDETAAASLGCEECKNAVV